jgi:hypothetical protein
MNVLMETNVKLYFFLMILISFCGHFVHLESSILVWPVPLAHYKIGKLNIASLMGFLIMFFFGYKLEEYLGGHAMYVSIFQTAKYERKSCLN